MECSTTAGTPSSNLIHQDNLKIVGSTSGIFTVLGASGGAGFAAYNHVSSVGSFAAVGASAGCFTPILCFFTAFLFNRCVVPAPENRAFSSQRYIPNRI